MYHINSFRNYLVTLFIGLDNVVKIIPTRILIIIDSGRHLKGKYSTVKDNFESINFMYYMITGNNGIR
jgi:hypothetical protein